ncbi:V-type ATP synthase subunit F [Peptoniphilus catoniae]|uniref:V-type ATP synthase subunit F n=1 Tax=Peptoniphilus catoniae TaxID=1660341 RepID=UPI0010FD8F73|nr:V-type ATP synthase subunit F [Peptoniphilus catoniae]
MRSLLLSRSLDVLAGLRLAGIEGIFCKDEDMLYENFISAKKRSDLGIIILTEDDFNLIKEEVIKQKLSSELPLVVTIPGRGGLKDKNLILKYVKESVGIKID